MSYVYDSGVEAGETPTITASQTPASRTSQSSLQVVNKLATGNGYVVTPTAQTLLQRQSFGGLLGLSDDQWKKIIIGSALALLFYFLFIRKGGVLRNPGKRRGKGKNTVARVSGSDSGGYFYRLLRSGAKKHGPFASRGEARDSAKCAGYRPI